MNWYDDLCEYYNVEPKKALELGTRASGRKPSLPESKTCQPVSDMTYEDIWESKPRKTIQEVFNFYKDQGAWSTFRQCVRHKDLVGLHMGFLKPFVKEGTHICEYGCGVAPFSFTYLNNMPKDMSLSLSISDVESEHFTFAKWRMDKHIKEKNLSVDFDAVPISPTQLPKYKNKLDLVLIFEVLEHVPSPVDVINNFMEQMNPECVLIENFIKTDHAHDDGPDLESAAEERDSFYKILSDNFRLVHGGGVVSSPNATRVWIKN